MPGLLNKKWKCKQIVWIRERRGFNTLKYTYDWHTVHTTILQKKKQCLSNPQQQYPSTIQHSTYTSRKSYYWISSESEISSIYYLQTLLYYFSIPHPGGDSARAILVVSSKSVHQVTYTPRHFLISYFKLIFCRIITLWGHHTVFSHHCQGGGLEILGQTGI